MNYKHKSEERNYSTYKASISKQTCLKFIVCHCTLLINHFLEIRWIFFASILLGVVLSILSGVLKETMGDAMLLLCAGVFVVAALCALVMFANVRRIKAYLRSLGIMIQ